MEKSISSRLQEISLYFHIPFCKKKCPYCHFYTVPDRKDLQNVFFEALQKEWALKKPLIANNPIVSIYFGGGTPTLLPSQMLEEILSWIPHNDDCEVTIEANPDGLDRALLEKLRQIGINRLSIGVQSLDDGSLQLLERRHSAHQAKRAIFDARDAGFENISIDLMIDLPHQSLESWQATLSAISDLPITHLSLYNLTIEPHTSFYLHRDRIQATVPSSDLSLQLLQTSVDHLLSIGYQRYEISAFAKDGHISRHNSGYWLGRPFLGLGPSAFSDWEGRRYRNIANLQRYKRALMNNESPIDFEETLPFPANILERLAIRLRLLEGVDLSAWNLPIETIAQLHRLKTDGLLTQENGRWKLTRRGAFLYDTVAVELIANGE